MAVDSKYQKEEGECIRMKYMHISKKNLFKLGPGLLGFGDSGIVKEGEWKALKKGKCGSQEHPRGYM
jgi:uncharacterized membrane protein